VLLLVQPSEVGCKRKKCYMLIQYSIFYLQKLLFDSLSEYGFTTYTLVTLEYSNNATQKIWLESAA